MSDADLLRRAAELMRARARAASEGPWTRFGHGGVAGKDWEIVDERRVECDGCGEPVGLVGCTTAADAEHIASWDPAVALTVADWLDTAYADWWMREGSIGQRSVRAMSGETNEPDPTALAVARAYLKEDQ